MDIEDRDKVTPESFERACFARTGAPTSSSGACPCHGEKPFERVNRPLQDARKRSLRWRNGVFLALAALVFAVEKLPIGDSVQAPASVVMHLGMALVGEWMSGPLHVVLPRFYRILGH
jgi:hypothetical protein